MTRRRIGAIVIALGLALGVWPAVMFVTAIIEGVDELVGTTPIDTPGAVVRTLEAERYLVFELEGRRTLSPETVHVTVERTGDRIPVRRYSSAEETLTLNDTTYEAHLAFDVPAEGRYRLRFSSTSPSEAAVTTSIVSAFGEIGRALLWMIPSVVVTVIGIALLIVALVTRRRNRTA